MTDATKPDDVTALMERCRAMIRRITADDAHIDNIIAALEDAADALDRLAADNARLTRERDEALAILAAADKGTPIYKAVERVLDEHSAWIARPNEAVTKSIALAVGAVWMAAEKVDPNLVEMDRALAVARADADRLRAILSDAVALYGRPGGPWNIPSDPGGWLGRARAALEQGGGDGR